MINIGIVLLTICDNGRLTILTAILPKAMFKQNKKTKYRILLFPSGVNCLSLRTSPEYMVANENMVLMNICTVLSRTGNLKWDLEKTNFMSNARPTFRKNHDATHTAFIERDCGGVSTTGVLGFSSMLSDFGVSLILMMTFACDESSSGTGNRGAS